MMMTKMVIVMSEEIWGGRAKPTCDGLHGAKPTLDRSLTISQSQRPLHRQIATTADISEWLMPIERITGIC
jgi:hypothetical protein